MSTNFDFLILYIFLFVILFSRLASKNNNSKIIQVGDPIVMLILAASALLSAKKGVIYSEAALDNLPYYGISKTSLHHTINHFKADPNVSLKKSLILGEACSKVQLFKTQLKIDENLLGHTKYPMKIMFPEPGMALGDLP